MMSDQWKDPQAKRVAQKLQKYIQNPFLCHNLKKKEKNK